MKKITIREIKPEEINKLEDMLYEAIYQPDENNLIPRTVLEIPEVNAYIKDFGSKKDDYCLVADSAGEIVGAVWVRVIAGEIKGYGYIDDNTPEFAISLYKEYRNKGIGTQLITSMITHLRKIGYSQTSLNVKKENYAVRLYKKMGFEIISEDNEDYLMLLNLEKNKLMDGKLSYRPVETADFKAICNLPQSTEELFYMFPKAEYPLTKSLLEIAVNNRFDSTVVLLNDEIVGFANFYEKEEKHYCSIGNVIVSSKFRNQGIGAFLIQTMECIALTKYNVSEIHISCFNTNTKGILLYSKLGYIPYAIEKRMTPLSESLVLVKLRKVIALCEYRNNN